MGISILNQYNAECLEALACTANLGKSFNKVFMDVMQLYMCIPGRINFLQMGRYGKFSEQTYRNNFTREDFDWLGFNRHISEKVLTGLRRVIAIDPCFIPKSGNLTPWIGKFWSGVAGAVKRGLELMGIAVIDVDNKESITLKAQQSPDSVTLDNICENLVSWYSGVLIHMKDELQRITRHVAADSYFAKETFITPMVQNGYHVISRFRNDAVLFYPTLEERTGRKGRPKIYDGKIDFRKLDLSRCRELKVDKGRAFSIVAYAKALKRKVSLVAWYPEGDLTKGWKLYFSTDTDMSGKDVIDSYRARFQVEFCFRDAKQFAGLTQCQSTDYRKLDFNFNASFASINLAKATCKSLGMPYSITSCKSMIHNAYMLERFICVSGLEPNKQLIDKLIKELVLFTATAA